LFSQGFADIGPTALQLWPDLTGRVPPAGPGCWCRRSPAEPYRAAKYRRACPAPSVRTVPSRRMPASRHN